MRPSRVPVATPTANTPAAVADRSPALPAAAPKTVAARPAFVVAAVTVISAAATLLGAVIFPNRANALSSAPLPRPLRDNCFSSDFFALIKSMRVPNSVEPIDSAISA